MYRMRVINEKFKRENHRRSQKERRHSVGKARNERKRECGVHGKNKIN